MNLVDYKIQDVPLFTNKVLLQTKDRSSDIMPSIIEIIDIFNTNSYNQENMKKIYIFCRSLQQPETYGINLKLFSIVFDDEEDEYIQTLALNTLAINSTLDSFPAEVFTYGSILETLLSCYNIKGIKQILINIIEKTEDMDFLKSSNFFASLKLIQCQPDAYQFYSALIDLAEFIPEEYIGDLVNIIQAYAQRFAHGLILLNQIIISFDTEIDDEMIINTISYHKDSEQFSVIESILCLILTIDTLNEELFQYVMHHIQTDYSAIFDMCISILTKCWHCLELSAQIELINYIFNVFDQLAFTVQLKCLTFLFDSMNFSFEYDIELISQLFQYSVERGMIIKCFEALIVMMENSIYSNQIYIVFMTILQNHRDEIQEYIDKSKEEESEVVSLCLALLEQI